MGVFPLGVTRPALLWIRLASSGACSFTSAAAAALIWILSTTPVLSMRELTLTCSKTRSASDNE